MKIFSCPNVECDYHGRLKEGQKCPRYGALAQSFAFGDRVHLFTEKHARKAMANAGTLEEHTYALNESVNRALLWQADETLVNCADGVSEFFEDRTQTLGVRIGNKGYLIVTNQRVVFACKSGFFAEDYGITYGINLEDVMSVSPGKFGFNDKLIILEKNGQHKDFIKLGINSLIPTINTTISERRNQLEAKRDKDRIQVVFDFSSLKDVLAKGGVVMSSYNCPKCNAMLDIPEAGKVMICKYCGAPIKPVDIFDRIKSLL